MRKKKKLLIITMLLITIGFAAVATTLYINGTTFIAGDQDAFDGDVIFTKANVEGGNAIISQDEKSITFETADLKSINDISTLEYTVTNNSSQYDANIEVNCEYVETVSEDDKNYITLENTLNDVVEARKSEDGTVDVKLVKVSDSIKNIKITCTLLASALERDTVAFGDEVSGSEEELNDYTLSGTLSKNINGYTTPLTEGTLVFFSNTPKIATIGTDGYFAVNGFELGNHEVYYMGTQDITNMTNDEIKQNAIAYSEFVILAKNNPPIIALECIQNRCESNTTFSLNNVDLESYNEKITGRKLYDYIKNNSLKDEIDFSISSDLSNTNGIYKTNNTKTSPVYYYRGNVNNNIIFNNMCWKIIRTTETGGIKLLYYGKPSLGKCNTVDIKGTLRDNRYSKFDIGNVGVGYMYNNHAGTSYEETHENVNDSNAKTTLDQWYQTFFKTEGVLSLIEDTVYCNDRSMLSGDNNSTLGEAFGENGYGKLSTAYGSIARSSYYTIKPNPSLVCPQLNDSFTVSDSIGNGKLTYPIGLMTTDEIVFAGYNTYASNPDHYINTNTYLSSIPGFTTMTPVYVNGDKGGYCYIGVLDANKINWHTCGSTYLRPVISLSNTTRILPNSDGSEDRPFIVNTEFQISKRINELELSYSDFLKFDPKQYVKTSLGDKFIDITCTKSEVQNYVYEYACRTVGNTGDLSTEIFNVKIIPGTKNKTAIFFGDSITNGHFSWPRNHVENRYDYFEYKAEAGVLAGTLTKNVVSTDNQNLDSILDKVDSEKEEKYDYIVMSGGINDFLNSAPIGKIKPNDFSGNYDENTFTGAAESYMYKAKTYWPNSKLAYIITYNLAGYEDRGNYGDYVNALKQVLNKWGIPYFDLYTLSLEGGEYYDLIHNDLTREGSDTIHVSSRVHKIINPAIFDWLNKIL